MAFSFLQCQSCPALSSGNIPWHRGRLTTILSGNNCSLQSSFFVRREAQTEGLVSSLIAYPSSSVPVAYPSSWLLVLPGPCSKCLSLNSPNLFANSLQQNQARGCWDFCCLRQNSPWFPGRLTRLKRVIGNACLQVIASQSSALSRERKISKREGKLQCRRIVLHTIGTTPKEILCSHWCMMTCLWYELSAQMHSLYCSCATPVSIGIFCFASIHYVIVFASDMISGLWVICLPEHCCIACCPMTYREILIGPRSTNFAVL